MPRKKVEGKVVKRRSRGGCHKCKRLKIKCDETKPRCKNCIKNDAHCDYSLVLSWGGRPNKREGKTDLTDGVVLEQISSLEQVFRPVPLSHTNEIQFIIENPAEDEEYALTPPDIPTSSKTVVVRAGQFDVLPLTPKSPPPKCRRSSIRDFAQDLARVEAYEVRMVRELSPLPSIINDNPMYRELFFHFLNVTCDVLAPLPITMFPNNPFRTVLPKMAIQTPHLLSLIFAYSAAHRAKFLSEPEPEELLSKLLSETFSGLTKSLKDESEAKSDATLATAIMLTTYEIMCARPPNDTWRTHLQGAREIVVARGLLDSWNMEHHPNAVRRQHSSMSTNEATWFLMRSFAYIDVIASLSTPSASSAFVFASRPINFPVFFQDVEVDAFLGVDIRLLPVFSRIAALVHQRQRVDLTPQDEQNMVTEAGQLSGVLIAACLHSTDYDTSYEAQLSMMNSCFCYAALIHLYRRVLQLASGSEPVQNAVRQIIDLVEKLPKAANAHACISFPIITGGGEAQDESLRQRYREKVENMMRFGVAHIWRAKDLLEMSWVTGRSWMELMVELNFDLALL